MKKNNLETLFDNINDLIEHIFTDAYDAGYTCYINGYGDDNNPTRAYLDSDIKKELDEFKDKILNKYLKKGEL